MSTHIDKQILFYKFSSMITLNFLSFWAFLGPIGPSGVFGLVPKTVLGPTHID